MSKKLMSILLSVAIVFTMIPMTAMAEVAEVPTIKDMPEDWSTEALENAINNGLLQGSDGKILPNDNLTRAEMATIINRSFKSYEKTSLEGFNDVSEDAWYFDEMAKAVQMKTFKGDGDNLNPNDAISREEAFAVIARAFKLDSTDVSPEGYADISDISTWATNEVYGLINAGYVQGSDGQINPKATITRAEFAQLMFNLVKGYVNTPGQYDTVAEGNVMINVPGVTLKDVTIDGDLIIGEGVGIENVTLDNVIITGRLLVRGGESISIKGTSQITKVIVARVDGPVKIVVEDDAVVDTVVINDGKDEVILEGAIKNVEVQTNEVSIGLENATVEKIIETVKGADIKVKEETKEPAPKETTTKPTSPSGGGGGGGGGSTPTAAERLRSTVASQVRASVNALNDGNNFNFSGKTITVVTSEYAELLKLSNTGIMSMLAGIDEITGYEMGSSTRDFYDGNDNRLSDTAIRDMIKSDLPSAINDDLSINVKVFLKDASTSTTDTYTFKFQ